MDTSPTDFGGYKQAAAAITGTGAYGMLKWENGVHRVQRVPSTESHGRVHTSTASVVAMPEATEVDVQVIPRAKDFVLMIGIVKTEGNCTTFFNMNTQPAGTLALNSFHFFH